MEPAATPAVPSALPSDAPAASASSSSASVVVNAPQPLRAVLSSGLVLRFDASAAAPTAKDGPLSIGTPPGTPQHMGIGENSAGSRSGAASGQPPRFRSLAAGAPSGGGKSSPGLPPLGLPPSRVDTDEDLMQKQVSFV
jgi:hypothetical protein